MTNTCGHEDSDGQTPRGRSFRGLRTASIVFLFLGWVIAFIIAAAGFIKASKAGDRPARKFFLAIMLISAGLTLLLLGYIYWQLKPHMV